MFQSVKQQILLRVIRVSVFVDLTVAVSGKCILSCSGSRNFSYGSNPTSLFSEGWVYWHSSYFTTCTSHHIKITQVTESRSVVICPVKRRVASFVAYNA